METIDIWKFLAGLGLFLFGMRQMEGGLRGLGSRTFKQVLRRYTGNPLLGVCSGTLATTLLQSSSLVGLFVLAFVGSGVMELRHALGVIFGSNLGTTFTGWIVTLLGFKLQLDQFSLPLLAIGSLVSIFATKASKTYFYGLIIFGIGLLLFGLGYMKQSMELLASSVSIDTLAEYPLLIYFIAAILFTAIIQSSSAMMMIILSGLHSGVLNLEMAAVMAIGADLGTTSTLLLGGMLNSPAIKKQVAMAHLLFNLITDCIALVLISPLLYFLQHILGLEDPLYTLVAFHSLFNLIGVALFLPLTRKLASFLQKSFSEQEHIASAYIHQVPAAVCDSALDAIHQETRRLMFKAILFSGSQLSIDSNKLVSPAIRQQFQLFIQPSPSSGDQYFDIKELQGELLAYIAQVQKENLSRLHATQLSQLHHCVRNATYAAKHIKDIRHNLVEMNQQTAPELTRLYQQFQEYMYDFSNQLAEIMDPQKTGPEKNLKAVAADLKQRFQQLNQHICSEPFLQSLSDIELSTQLNINKALFDTCMALLEASKGLD